MPTLKPFQQEGAAFLAARTRALLADEPGVGKTGQLITAANMVGARSLGVVCPSIGIRHWEREADKWNYQGDRLDVIAWDDAHEAAKALDPRKVPMQWDVLIPDEVHFGKNPQARRTRAVFAPGGLAWYGRRLWPASGTPAPNNVSELYPMMKALGKTKMDAETFKTYYCIVDPISGKVRGNRPERVEELRAILKSFALRRLKRDVLPELGEIDIQDWYVEPDSRFIRGGTFSEFHDAAHESAQLEAELRGKSAEEILVFLAGDQEFSTLRRYNALLKAPAVFETVKFEIESELVDKIVIYGYHKEALAALDRAFHQAGIACALVYGDTPQELRDDIIETWKRSGQVLLASMMVASTVLDFTCAHQGIALEMDWVPANNWQAWQRMHRHGQENPVTIRVAHGTPVDEIINGVVVRKTKQLAEIFG